MNPAGVDGVGEGVGGVGPICIVFNQCASSSWNTIPFLGAEGGKTDGQSGAEDGSVNAIEESMQMAMAKMKSNSPSDLILIGNSSIHYRNTTATEFPHFDLRFSLQHSPHLNIYFPPISLRMVRQFEAK